VLNKQQLENAAKCRDLICIQDCQVCIDAIEGQCGECTENAAQTALAYRDMLKRLEWGAIAKWGNDRHCVICHNLKSGGHTENCELAKLLNDGA